jgi:hypothetical protein
MPIVEPRALPEKEGDLVGRYPMTVEKAGSSSPGSFWVLFKLTGGEDQNGQPAAGRTVLQSYTTDFETISDKIQNPEMFRRIQGRKLREAGEILDFDPEGSFDTDDLIGKDCEGLVKSFVKKDGSEGQDITKLFKAS